MDVDVSRFLSSAALWVPDHTVATNSGTAHVPFAFWLIDTIRPRLVVEIGSEPGSVHLAFSQAAVRLGLSTSCQMIEFRDGSDPVGGQDEPGVISVQALDRRVSGGFFSLVRCRAATALDRLDRQSIDMLHLAGPAACQAFGDDFPGWLERMSNRGLIILTEISVHEPDLRARRTFQTLSRSYPAFEFTHDRGLGIVAIGDAIPERLAKLFESSREPALADQVRGWYHRLGQGLHDRVARIELERVNGALEEQLAAIRGEQALHGLLREQAATLLEETWLAEEERRASSGAIEDLQGETRNLKEQLSRIDQAHRALVEEMSHIRQSLGWALLQRARRLRMLLFRENHVSGRCWKVAARLIRAGMSSGPRAAAGKAATKLRRALGLTPSTRPAATSHPVLHLAGDGATGRRFEELPWVYTGERPVHRPGETGYYKVLLISHSACRTGAPHCLLRLAQALSGSPELECWIVLQTGGELGAEFARVAPTLDASRLAEIGISVADAPGVIASLFRGFTSRGIAICNTIAVSKFHAALADCGIPVLSWIHELPTMVDLFGGGQAVERVAAASQQIVVPAEVVRDAWIRRFAIEPERVHTFHNGVDARAEGLDRAAMRSRVRRELGIPDDGLIVLGCGTIDLRKGADLYAQVACKLLTRPDARDIAAKTWFVWVGDLAFPTLDQWVTHDAEIGGYKGRLIFAGQRSNTAPYFAAADVFALTSREDPCPFSNLEAMESGVPVVVFQDAGGAPDVIGGAGIAVPFLDVDAMAAAVIELLGDARKSSEMGAAGREIIRRDFTWPGFMEQFRGVLKQSYGVFPPRPLRVSVIVPNYGHAPYLEERLRSIFRQTILPHEIIVLDDASPDESVSVIERLMRSSPVPIRLVVNEANSGSTFRQWIKGVEQATGDVIWLAESDDSCHPQFIERLLPEFYDPEVALAYCQSELIGPDGKLLEAHFLAHTDDISTARWRSRYCVSGTEEIELALSQKNTIPNASAMLFRRPRRLDFLDELFGLKFAGDWLLYTRLCRDGKVAYLPDVLNRYRRHVQTVSHRAVRGDTYLSETLRVKRRVFETFDVSARAMARSLAQTVFEYHRLDPEGKARSASPAKYPAVQDDLGRIRSILHDRCRARSALRTLLVLDNLSPGLPTLSAIHLANALADHHTVFVCNARPQLCDPDVVAHLDSRVLLIEGSPGEPEWPLAKQHQRRWGESDIRTAILEQLIELHAIDVIDSRSRHADELTRRVNRRLQLPWFSQGRHEQEQPAPHEAKGRPRKRHERGDSGMNALAAYGTADLTCLELGLDADLLARGIRGRSGREGEFTVLLASDDGPRSWHAKVAATAARVINRMPESDRGGKRVSVIVDLAGNPLRSPLHLALRPRAAASRPPNERALEVLIQSDVILVPDPLTTSQNHLVIAALGLRIPVITPASEHSRRMLVYADHHAGLLLPVDPANGFDLDRLIAAVLTYLTQSDLYASHQAGAEAIFKSRFAAQRIAELCSAAYHEACHSLARRRDQDHSQEGSGDESTPTRQSA
jgi:glycosyltransferase involved in cell wall biosynthesis